MKKRSLSGNVGVIVFFIAAVCVLLSFCSSSWLVSDRRITSSKFEQMGLWKHCFRSLPDPTNSDAPTRYFVGCRWIFDPYTAGYDKLKPFFFPTWMIFVELFYTICFLCFVATTALIIIYTTCWDPEKKNYIELLKAISGVLTIGSVLGCFAVLIFALFGNGENWMPGHFNNFFGWAFVLAVVGSVLGVVASILMLVELNIQRKKQKKLKESQTRFTLESRA